MKALTIPLWLCLLLLSAATAEAQSAPFGGVGLVLGSGTYQGLPPLPACLASAHAVAAALRRLGYTVVEQEDGSVGEMDAALSRFTQQVRQAGTPPTVIYGCGYVTRFNDRPFLLPASAAVARPADVLTQGMLVRAVLDTVSQAKAGPSLTVLDVVPAPGSATDLGLDALPQADIAPQLGFVAASEPASTGAPLPLSDGLVSALEAPAPVTVSRALQALQTALDKQPAVQLAAVRPPVTDGPLVAAPPATPAVAVAPAAPAPAAAKPPPPAIPYEQHMTQADRRRVQTVLTQLGYYDGQVDGIFGPDTRAAIRRWQHEKHAPMTGTLTAAQAGQLLGS